MTVYKAKGLEFPVVILADPTYKATRDVPNRYVDAARRLWLEPLCGSTPIELREASDVEMNRDRAEAIRVAYVAATRARDLLIVPVCGDQPIEGWVEVLNPMLYPSDDSRRNSEPAPGCPAFGEDSVLERGPKGQRARCGLGPSWPAHAGGRRGPGRVVGSGRACTRGRGAGAASAPTHPRGRSGWRRGGGERAELRGVEDGARGPARKGVPAVAVGPDRYFARTPRGAYGYRECD